MSAGADDPDFSGLVDLEFTAHYLQLRERVGLTSDLRARPAPGPLRVRQRAVGLKPPAG